MLKRTLAFICFPVGMTLFFLMQTLLLGVVRPDRQVGVPCRCVVHVVKLTVYARASEQTVLVAAMA